MWVCLCCLPSCLDLCIINWLKWPFYLESHVHNQPTIVVGNYRAQRALVIKTWSMIKDVYIILERYPYYNLHSYIKYNSLDHHLCSCSCCKSAVLHLNCLWKFLIGFFDQENSLFPFCIIDAFLLVFFQKFHQLSYNLSLAYIINKL